MIDDFTAELQELLEKHGLDKELNVPVWIIGRYLNDSLGQLRTFKYLVEQPK